MLTVAPIVLLAITVFFLIRKWDLRPIHGLVCVLLGFYLASSSIAPGITDGLAKVTGLISDINL